MFKLSRILLGLLLLLTGCATPVRRATDERPPDWEVSRYKEPEPAPKITPAPRLPPVTPPVAVTSPPPVFVPPPTLPPPVANTADAGWVSLNRWGAARGFGPLRKVLQTPMNAYAISTTNGTLVVQMGALTAYWDRMEILLGFPPRLIGDQVFVNSLDLKKNIEPLLRGLSAGTNGYKVIVIDPGHGGLNYGTRSAVDNRWEKELTLDWAERIAALLVTNGWQVWLTRSADVDVSLADRVAFAETHHADLFVSLHFNSPGGSGGRDAAGLETYCLTPVNMSSTLKREFTDDPTQYFPNNAFDEQNVQVAARLQRALLAVNGDNDRGVRRARFLTVLQGQRRPAVLIEGGYLSNVREAKRISEPAYRQMMAEAVARALNSMMPRPPTPERVVPPTVVASRPPETAPVKSPTNDLRPDVEKIKPEIAPAAEKSETNTFQRMMTTQPIRLHSPRNAP